jgi:hypothetical protein
VRLLDERYAPLTYSFGFIERPLDAIAAELTRWRRSLPQIRDVTVERLSKPLVSALEMLDPLSVHRERELLVRTQSRWIAYFASSITGGDPSGPVSVLSDALGARALIVTDRPATMDDRGIGTYGARTFQMFDRGTELRVVQALQEGSRWSWHAEGQLQPFETAELYETRRISDRLSSDTLVAYCESLGIRLVEPGFYLPDAMLVQYRPVQGLPLLEESLEVRRKKLGLPPLGVAPARERR